MINNPRTCPGSLTHSTRALRGRRISSLDPVCRPASPTSTGLGQRACFAGAVSYDLVFWKQQEDANLGPAMVARALQDAEPPAGLVELPIEAWLEELLTSFPGAVREPNGQHEWIDWVSSDERQSFQVEWSAVHVWVTCRHTDSATMNRIIDIALGFGCPLYDPQTDERFDSAATH